MGLFPKPSFFILFITLTFTLSAISDPDSDPVTELVGLQSQSTNGIIHLDEASVSRFIATVKPPRSYWLLIFFDATHLHDKSELHLTELRKEFRLVASTFRKTNQDPTSPSHGKFFFCEVDFKESQSSFQLFGVNSLPHIRLVSPDQRPKNSDKMEQVYFSGGAESMAEFIQLKTPFVVGKIERPPMFSRNQLIFFAVALLVSIPYLLKRIIMGQTLFHDSRVWLCGAIFIYFFSVSGAMHNIIRKMPMFIADRKDPSKLVFFYQGAGMQLGAEGFAIGFLYTIVGLLLAFMTQFLVKVKNVNIQRGVMVAVLFICFWAVRQVISIDNWKTGYGIHGYWPSSWE